MKKVLSILMAAMFAVAMVSCEKDEPEDNPGGDNPGVDLTTQLVGKWQSEHILINGEEQAMQMTIIMNADGTGNLGNGSETFSWHVDGNNVVVTNPHGNTFSFTVTNITDQTMVITGNTIPGTSQQAQFEGHFKKATGDNPGDPDPGDLGIGTPELVSSTESTITVSSHVTGSVGDYLWQFPNYSCGIIWCPESDGTPTMNSNTVTGNTDSYGNFEVTISGLNTGTEYTMAAWLKHTPESTPIISEPRTFSTENGSTPGSNWVNLGLPSGLLWASCNVGATCPEDYGDYYAWGETQTKSVYNWGNYRYGQGSHQLTKYCDDPNYGANGYTDNLTTLQPGDDAATANLGNGARTPTKAEWEEMVNNTTHIWTNQNGVNGWKFTAPNGNSIFLPAAGDFVSTLHDAGAAGHYWTSTLGTDGPDYAWQLGFTAAQLGGDLQIMTRTSRYGGCSVRAVKNAK